MLGNPVWRRIAVWSVGVTAVGGFARGADVTVDSLADELHVSGCAATGQSPCSLRDAITWSNANPGRDRIVLRTLPTYNAPESYRLRSALPPVTDAVDLVGQRDPRWFPLAWPVIDGTDAGVADGLTLATNDCLVRSIWIQGFRGRGLVVKGDRNVIGGENSVLGASAVIAQGVHIGGNAGAGIEIQSGTGNAILGSVVGPNRGAGVLLGTGAWGNRIGALEAPTSASDSGTSNTIAGNGGAGIRVGTGSGDVSARANVIGLNSIRSNVGPGIDLGGDCLPAERDPPR